MRLTECEGPDNKQRKRKCLRLKGDESPKPILAMPLQAAAPGASLWASLRATLLRLGREVWPRGRRVEHPREARGALDESPSLGGISALKRTLPSRERLDVGNFKVANICPEEELGDSTP